MTRDLQDQVKTDRLKGLYRLINLPVLASIPAAAIEISLTLRQGHCFRDLGWLEAGTAAHRVQKLGVC